MSDDKESVEHTSLAAKPTYEAPAIEEIMTTNELEREVHYAGQFSGIR